MYGGPTNQRNTTETPQFLLLSSDFWQKHDSSVIFRDTYVVAQHV